METYYQASNRRRWNVPRQNERRRNDMYPKCQHPIELSIGYIHVCINGTILYLNIFK